MFYLFFKPKIHHTNLNKLLFIYYVLLKQNIQFTYIGCLSFQIKLYLLHV